jgi:hypothetical protein
MMVMAHKSIMVVMEADEAVRAEANTVAIAVGKVVRADEENVDDFADFDDEQAALLVSFQPTHRDKNAHQLMAAKWKALKGILAERVATVRRDTPLQGGGMPPGARGGGGGEEEPTCEIGRGENMRSRRRRFLRGTKPGGTRTWKLWRRGIAGSLVGGGGRRELGYQGDDGGTGEGVGGGSPRKSPLR